MTGTNMRPASRTPPFLLVGLLVALCILAFNYWNLSGKNSELALKHRELSRQYDTLQVEFRALTDKHLASEKRSSDIATQLSDQQEQIKQLQSGSAQKDAQIQSLTDEKSGLNNQLKDGKRELVSIGARGRLCHKNAFLR
jgi:chromosome segregation ATPase